MTLRDRLVARGWDLAGHPTLRILEVSCPACGERMSLVVRRGDGLGACIVCDAPLSVGVTRG